MGISNKMLMMGAAGAATLAFVGVGAGASFTNSATASGSVQTGTVGISLTANSPTATSGGQPVTVTNTQNGNSFSLSVPGVVGSDFTATIPMTLANTGSLPIKSLSLTLSGVPNNQLAKDTNVSLVMNGKTVAGPVALSSLPTSTVTFHNLPGNVLGVGDHVAGSIVLAPKDGKTGSPGYQNQDEGQTLAATLMATGSDV